MTFYFDYRRVSLLEGSMEPSLDKIGITTKLEGSVVLLVRATLIFLFFFPQASITAGGSLSQICGFLDLIYVIVSRDFLSCFMKIRESNLE